MPLDRDWIAQRIPHAGAMCLLDRVLTWDAGRLRCVAVSHLSPGNPLRAGGRLSVVCGIEYAAQATAVHGALRSVGEGVAPRSGFLVSVRDVEFHVRRLDTLDGDLVVEVERLTGDGNDALYRFRLLATDGRELLTGRLAVRLDAEAGEGGVKP
ncbi:MULTISPECIES: hotdog family protein [Methylococcus]|jgi:predicted hotdog family 3-hydroxylacyl-ACP dehydratase|uniref:(3R)-hydroxymyristoyl-acyl-carrier-protein dehydratase n=1 Tax=Methylococcus capsulatus TaxID=414 RepID=A0AA35UFW1_METCP|nr:hotdog family protein [Methylococcus capsulatus]QXP88322.1 hotdog family protein [Methylococcus capsulatus]QXP94670.1 hotdog family protein [Methylococcus capsulatus]UQN13361.1 hotdog family protein [Methylococcus capsulatus]CAI8736541.1 putative (3R)-hydroxymyristoyl-acyl-carrier-protein dehydratase [Methylococcus capsulatus]